MQTNPLHQGSNCFLLHLYKVISSGSATDYKYVLFFFFYIFSPFYPPGAVSPGSGTRAGAGPARPRIGATILIEFPTWYCCTLKGLKMDI